MSAGYRPVTSTSDTAQTDGEDFLHRWSRRKTAAARGVPEVDESRGAAAEVEPETADEPVDPGDRIDARTGKRYDDLTDDDMPDPETLNESSDLRMFLARNVSPAVRMKALTRVFHSATYNQICICAEYAEDYTNFEPLGDIIPHDMKSAIVREAGKLRARLMDAGSEISQDDAEQRILRETRAGPRFDTGEDGIGEEKFEEPPAVAEAAPGEQLDDDDERDAQARQEA